MIKVLIATLPPAATSDTVASFQQLLRSGFVSPTGYSQPEKILSCIMGRLLCQQLLLDMGIGEEKWNTLQRGPYGKWKMHAPVDFNVSHSGRKVVAVATDRGGIGVDIEEVREIDVSEYKECFSAEEWRSVRPGFTSETFFRLWTKKESLTKAYGVGLQVPLNTVLVTQDTGKILNTSMTGYFRELSITGYCSAVCTTLRGHELHIRDLGIIEEPGQL